MAQVGTHDTPAMERYFSEASLLLALTIPALQAMGVVVNPWLASFLWTGVFFVLILMMWKGENKWNWFIKAAVTVFASVGFVALLYRSFAGPIVPVAKVKVYFFEDHPIAAEDMDFKSIEEFPAFERDKLAHAAVVDYPTHLKNGRIYMNVVMRNVGDVAMRDASIHMISTVPIRPESTSMGVFSDNELNWELRTGRRYEDRGTQYLNTVSFEPPASDATSVMMMVTVESDNSAPYSCYQIFHFRVPPGERH